MTTNHSIGIPLPVAAGRILVVVGLRVWPGIVFAASVARIRESTAPSSAPASASASGKKSRISFLLENIS